MAWERFHYICRRSLAPLRHDESVNDRIKTVEAAPDTNLYGNAIKPGTLPRRILDWMAAHPEPERTHQLLRLYAGLNFATETRQPLQLKRVVIYLTYVSVLFLIINGIYQLKVAPSFIALFDVFGVQTPYHVALFRDYGFTLALLVLSLLMVALAIGHSLKNLADWSSSHRGWRLTRFLILPGVRAAYANLEVAILYPLGPDAVDSDSRVASHLRELERQGNDVPTEIAALVRSQHQILVELCEKQMRWVYAVCVLLIVAMIGLFLVSAYSPIFMTGDVL